MTAADRQIDALIIALGLKPHPEGGWYAETRGCTVSPGFEFSGFEMAPEGWAPEQAS